MVRVLILPAPSGREHPLYPSRKHKSVSSPSALGSASRSFGVSWSFIIPSSLEVWTLPFPEVSGFCGKCQTKVVSSCNFQVMVSAEWPFLATCPAWLWWNGAAPSWHQALAWAGLATAWAGVEWTLLPDPHILLQGSCSLAQEPVGGFSQCSAGVPGQHSGEELFGHPWNLVEIPFFSVDTFELVLTPGEQQPHLCSLMTKNVIILIFSTCSFYFQYQF